MHTQINAVKKKNLFEAQADIEKTRSEEVGDQYTRVVSFCSN